MVETMIQQVPARVRLAMLRAATQVFGERAGVRMLHIKGDAVDTSLRAMKTTGSDVDVLVDPRRIGALHTALLQAGWSVYSTFHSGSPFGHAQTYFHGDWGHLDVHRRFPGIQIPDADAFELLWESRIPGEVAGIEYRAPSVDAQAVLLMLNSARDSRHGRQTAERLWGAVGAEQKIRCLALVAELDAVVAFAAATGRLEAYAHRREYRLWKAVSQGGSRIAEWWGRIRAQRTLRDAVRVGARSVLVNRERLEHRLGHSPSARDVLAEFSARSVQGLREAWLIVFRRRR
ncbi:nucleotidyltransferase family protein [Microbacterium sp. SD291]|uniref:nucleotidyltransferase family protein n=1 Tax=Microbacterium sp. SD291 TaxID=2782007 RepID=UPI001A9779AF|nr:nucleotidyltransferase family protein [Microbacterium sp. SD291]MBO0980986.1 hypothetical protein [Microbacterium sp. SD291]